jgi:3-oxoadipate enol-lactonase
MDLGQLIRCHDAKIGSRGGRVPFDTSRMSIAHTRHVDCRGREAVVEVSGSGPDVLFVGTAVPMAWSRPTAEALAGLGFRVTNFDYGSGHPSPEYRSALDQIDDVVAVMDALGLDAPVVVGLSRGGITAYGLAARHPDRVSALVLVLPVAPFADTLNIAEPEPEQGTEESDEDFMLRGLSRLFSEEFLTQHYEAAVSLATMPPGSVDRLERHQEDTISDGETVECPALVIEGGADQIVTSEHPLRYLRAIPDAEHVVMREAGHGLPMEQPEALAGLIADFASA